MLERKISRRTFLKKLYRIGISFLYLSSFGYAYARYFEPRQLQITHHELQSDKLPLSFDGLRVALFSDTHLGHNYTLGQLDKLVTQINKQKPDFILFSGDLMDAPNQYENPKAIIPILQKLSARLGKYAIYGNHDHGGYGSDIYKNVMKEADFTLLRNESVTIKNQAQEMIKIAGIDDMLLGKPDFNHTFKNISDDDYTILMVHEPDAIDKLVDYPFSIQLSGHSHGGQVKLPFLGPLIKTPGAIRYYEGFYSINHVEKRLFVNRGIGTTRMPFRFMSYPELTIFTLKSYRPKA